MSTTPPHPGTDAAQALGCSCPVIDNHRGRGYYGNGAKYGWIITEGCSLHDRSAGAEDCNCEQALELQRQLTALQTKYTALLDRIQSGGPKKRVTRRKP